MRKSNIRKAIKEAERFLRAARDAEKVFDDTDYLVCGTKETGAARRASMDLTRALAEMRKT